MKKLIIAVVMFLCIIAAFSSCEKTDHTPNADFLFASDSLEPQVVNLGQYFFDMSIDGDRIYLLGNDSVSFYSGVSDAIEPFVSDAGNAIDAYNNEVAVLNNDSVIIFDSMGVKQTAIQLDNSGITKMADIILNGKYIIVTGYEADLGYIRNRLFLIDRKSGNITELFSANEDKSVYAIMGMDFLDDDKLAITAKVTMDFFADENILTVIDLASDRVDSETILPYASEICCTDENTYYANDMKICRYDINQDITTVLRSYTKDYLHQSSSLDISLIGRKLCITDSNIVYLFPTNNTLYIDRLEYDNKPIRIIVPESKRFLERFEDEIVEFVTEKKTQVEITELPAANYTEKINLMLMSEDDSFDFFLLTDVGKSHTLKGIIEKQLYHPMDGYASVDELLSQMYGGVRDLATYQGEIYGLPMEFGYVPLGVNHEVFKKYDLPVPSDNWTYQDVWALCEKLKTVNGDVRVFSNDYDVLGKMLVNWGEDHYEDGDLLADLVQNYLTYLREGVLAFGSDGSFNDNCEYLFRTFHDQIIPYYEEEDPNLLKWPVIEADDHDTGKLLSVLLMNPKESDPETVTEFLPYLCQNEEFRLFYNDKDRYSNIAVTLQPNLTMNSAVIDKILHDAAAYISTGSLSEVCQSILDTIDYMING